MSLWAVGYVLAVFAACRLTRLFTHDDITTGLRLRLARRGEHDLLWRLVRCPWCLGFWITAATCAAAWLAAPAPIPAWFTLPAEIFTGSQFVGWLAGWDPTADDE